MGSAVDRATARRDPGPPVGADGRQNLVTLIDSLGSGGGERVAVASSVLARPDRFRRTLCVTREPEDTGNPVFIGELNRLRQAGVEVVFLQRRHRLDVRPLWHLARLLRSRRAHVVHAHKFGSNVWGAVLGRLVGVPVVIAHEHTWSFERQLVRRSVDRFIVAGLSDVVIAVSEADRRRMIEVVKMPAERVVTIPNGIPDADAADGSMIRAELDIPGQAPVLVQTAVLRPQKAIGVMLAALASVRVTYPDVRLLVVGPGDAGDLRRQATELGVADNVDFMGLRNDVRTILQAANIGVLSSDFEGMPLAVLEYMAAGLPVVSTDVGGVPELVRDGESGFLVPRGDAAGLARRIAELLDDPARATSMGNRGRQLQQEHFSDQVMAARTMSLYDRLLDSKGVRAS